MNIAFSPPDISDEEINEVIESLKKIPNIITAHYEESYEPYVDTWCPTFDYYDNAMDREHYENQDHHHPERPTATLLSSSISRRRRL